jgi:hypothetical protein
VSAPSIPTEALLAFIGTPRKRHALVNAHGIRIKLVTDEETGLPLEPSARGPGVIRFWRFTDRSRRSLPDTHVLEFTIPMGEVPCERAEPALVLPGSTSGVLQIDPRRDVFSAPDHVASIELVTCLEPEQLHSVNPRPSDWRPEA